MQLFYLFIAAVLILLLAGFTSYLFVTIIFNVKAGVKYRQSLAARLHSLRISKMLSALGIDTHEYLHQERAVDIRQHMKRCAECENTVICDEQLEHNAITTENINYCNNEGSMKAMLLNDIVSGKQTNK